MEILGIASEIHMKQAKAGTILIYKPKQLDTGYT
jgi:hypothetical protein